MKQQQKTFWLTKQNIARAHTQHVKRIKFSDICDLFLRRVVSHQPNEQTITQWALLCAIRISSRVRNGYSLRLHSTSPVNTERTITERQQEAKKRNKIKSKKIIAFTAKYSSLYIQHSTVQPHHTHTNEKETHAMWDFFLFSLTRNKRKWLKKQTFIKCLSMEKLNTHTHMFLFFMQEEEKFSVFDCALFALL